MYNGLMSPSNSEISPLRVLVSHTLTVKEKSIRISAKLLSGNHGIKK
jgi:hypothetical protein